MSNAINAINYRNAVIDNRENCKRTTAEQIGCDAGSFTGLTNLYRKTLDAITDWANSDYIHSNNGDIFKDAAFNAIKEVLALFVTDDNRIIIDEASLRSIRDVATQPKRQYSDEYKAAKRALKRAEESMATYVKMANAIVGCPKQEVDESYTVWADRIIASGINTKANGYDIAENIKTIDALIIARTNAIEDIKTHKGWSWRQATAVNLAVFAEMVENYVADCLIDNYNLKTSKKVREQAKADKEAAKAEKTADIATI